MGFAVLKVFIYFWWCQIDIIPSKNMLPSGSAVQVRGGLFSCEWLPNLRLWFEFFHSLLQFLVLFLNLSMGSGVCEMMFENLDPIGQPRVTIREPEGPASVSASGFAFSFDSVYVSDVVDSESMVSLWPPGSSTLISSGFDISETML
jgi:hypothetical protein